MTRREEYEQIFSACEEQDRQLISRLIDECIFLEERMTEMKRLPFVAVNPKNPSQQRTTSAAKVYKECSQSYMNAIRILSGILRKTEPDAQDDLMNLLNGY